MKVSCVHFVYERVSSGGDGISLLDTILQVSLCNLIEAPLFGGFISYTI